MAGRTGVAAASPLTRSSPAGEVVLGYVRPLDLAARARADGEDTFTYGLMHQRQACQAAALEQALPRSAAARGDRAAGH